MEGPPTAPPLPAAERRAESVNDPSLAHLAPLALHAVAVCPEAAEAWAGKHKPGLRGSSRLLRALAAGAGGEAAAREVKLKHVQAMLRDMSAR